jgi:hypothetical protein
LLWGNVKGVELANLCPQTIDEAWEAAEAGLVRAGNDYQLCFKLLDHTGLSLCDQFVNPIPKALQSVWLRFRRRGRARSVRDDIAVYSVECLAQRVMQPLGRPPKNRRRTGRRDRGRLRRSPAGLTGPKSFQCLVHVVHKGMEVFVGCDGRVLL